ncbi:MAG: hypothetical protein M3R17_08815 [Bacteroidota bacterium]|nr:hypothetical protein [Bacteroidota bacterium]
MRYILFLFLFLGGTILSAQNTPVLDNMKKKSAHSIRVRVVEGLIDSKTAGPVLVEIVEVYKSKTLHVGDRIAIRMQPFSIADDSAKVNHLANGNELIVFLSKDEPKSFSKNSRQYSYYSMYDDWIGWMFFSETVGEIIKRK